MSRATEELLDQLHGLVAGTLSAELERAIKIAKDNPDDPKFGVNPQLIDKVIKFLVSNGVSAPKAAPKIDALATQLADLDLDAIAASAAPH